MKPDVIGRIIEKGTGRRLTLEELKTQPTHFLVQVIAQRQIYEALVEVVKQVDPATNPDDVVILDEEHVSTAEVELDRRIPAPAATAPVPEPAPAGAGASGAAVQP